ncbi:unnamed protein product [Angiostrongylus costaricensis]|uniref:Peptidase M12A domain-containing protein n=1 Tax=Angiostrongylus costaricensis TaxID=334426 RepID=A0A3P7IG13_ANGCS|nr:unnamed protein product [Angiostrongylus costaricensis]
MHELGYAIGGYYTQARYDRDNFIALRLENARDGWEHHFAKESERTNYNYISYDYGTVMPYGATAVAKFSVFEVCVSATELIRNDEYLLLNVPSGSTIEVIFQNYTQNLAYDGCVWDGVKIKTLKNQRHTDYRFCSPDYYGTSLISTTNMVPVITYSIAFEITSILRYRIRNAFICTF